MAALEGGKLDTTFGDGVGKPSEDQPNLPSPQPVKAAPVVIDAGSKLSGHAVEIAGFLGATARYGGYGVEHPATGSRIPNATSDDDYSESGIKQQDVSDAESD